MRERSRTAAFVAGTMALGLSLSTAHAKTDNPALSRGLSRPVRPPAAPAASRSAADTDPLPAGCDRTASATVKSGRVPWPIVFRTSCGGYVLLRDGRLGPLTFPSQPGPRYRVSAGQDAWAEVLERRVVVTRRGSVIWRSTGSYDPQTLGAAVLGSGWVAFSQYSGSGGSSTLYLSAIPGDERPVAQDEEPLAAVASGALIVSRWRSDGSEPDLWVRQTGGALAGLIARGVGISYAEPESGTLLYQRGRTLLRTDGTRSWTVARMGGLGVPGLQWIDRLQDGRILVTGRRAVALLAGDGRMLEHATLARIPKGGTGWINAWASQSEMSSAMSIDQSTGGLILLQALWLDASAGGGPGWEGLYELAPGGSSARLLFGKRLTLAVCAHDSSVSWHGRWLLYRACEGRVVAIDTSGLRSAIDLTAIARSLPMPTEERGYGLWSAEWAVFGSEADIARTSRVN
ncbi:MAG TPA: hypothetical protein VGL18_10450 [Actinomycetota bacterium]